MKKPSSNHRKHSKFKINNNLFYCEDCSSFIFHSKTDQKPNNSKAILIARSSNYDKTSNFLKTPLFTCLFKEKFNNCSFSSFLNKKSYLKYRKIQIKNMKLICTNFNLSQKTYYLSIQYLDKICSDMSSFNKETLQQISLFCIILASKFNETAPKSLKVQSELKNKASENYKSDEIYVLKLLDYELNQNTVYDLLSEMLNCGLVFEDEICDYKKLDEVYSMILKILYIFTENSSYLDLTYYQIAISIIGFVRELLGLEPFSKRIIELFFNDPENVSEEYLKVGLMKIKKRFRINEKVKSEKNKGIIIQDGLKKII